LALLCQCAAKHQPIEFAPSFALKPRGVLTSETLLERRQLESRADLSSLEKKRLLELYELELRTLKTGSPLHERLREEISYLQTELAPLQEESQKAWQDYRELARESREEAATRAPLKHRGLKRVFDETYQLWNQDQNASALERVDEILRDPVFKDEVKESDWYLVHNLRFRVAIDMGLLPVAEESYSRLHDIDECAERTATAGFLLALHRFAGGNAEGALQILDQQCDKDKSVSNRLKRMYWRARFQEPSSPRPEDVYRDLLGTRVPGYYFYVACSRLGRKVDFASRMFQTRSFLKREIEMPRRVHGLLLLAEERLKSGLKRDAEAYLLQAAVRMRNDPDPEDLPALLYIAHLLQAAEGHVEAMRLYSIVTDALQEPREAAPVEFDFVDDMFPRPFAANVDAASRQWGVDPDLIYALMRQESAFNPEAASVADARGLMQLMPFLAKSLADQWGYGVYYSDKYLFHGDENVKLATVHLHQLQTLVPHIALIAASYNAGFHRVSGWWKRWGSLPVDVFIELIPITETRNYVKLVIRNFLYYKAARNRGSVQAGAVSMELPPYSG
jgi:soluble lytic murein transglycosylase-like protein